MPDYTEIENLFVHRLKEYQRHTDDILESIPNAVEGIKQTLVGEQYDTLQWDDTQYSIDEGVLLLIGSVRLQIGENIQLDDGRVVNITEENVETLRRLIRVAIPIDVAVNGSVEEVVEYFADKQHKNYAPITNEDGEPQNVEDLLSEELVEEYHSKVLKDQMESVLGFDTEGLTDEQIEQILLTSTDRKVH